MLEGDLEGVYLARGRDVGRAACELEFGGDGVEPPEVGDGRELGGRGAKVGDDVRRRTQGGGLGGGRELRHGAVGLRPLDDGARIGTGDRQREACDARVQQQPVAQERAALKCPQVAPRLGHPAEGRYGACESGLLIGGEPQPGGSVPAPPAARRSGA